MGVGQEQLVHLGSDTEARHMLANVNLSQFWISMLKSYPNVAATAIKILIPISSTYLCKLAFSKMLNIKTNKSNCFDVKPDLRCSVSTPSPRIPNSPMKCNTNHRICYIFYFAHISSIWNLAVLHNCIISIRGWVPPIISIRCHRDEKVGNHWVNEKTHLTSSLWLRGRC